MSADMLAKCRVEIEARLRKCDAARWLAEAMECGKHLPPASSIYEAGGSENLDWVQYGMSRPPDDISLNGPDISMYSEICVIACQQSADIAARTIAALLNALEAEIPAASRNERPGELRIIAAMLDSIAGDLLSDARHSECEAATYPGARFPAYGALALHNAALQQLQDIHDGLFEEAA